MPVQPTQSKDFDVRRTAVLWVLAILASGLFLPVVVLEIADSCHPGYGTCLSALLNLVLHYGEAWGFNIFLGWTMLLFAPIAYRLLRTAPDRATRVCITLTWVMLLLSKGIMGFFWGPIDILLITVISGWAGRRVVQTIGFLASAGFAILTTFYLAQGIAEAWPPLPKGSEVVPTNVGSAISAVVYACLFFCVPVAVWACDARDWTLLALMKRRRWFEKRG